MDKEDSRRIKIPKKRMVIALATLVGGLIISALIFFNTAGLPFDVGVLSKRMAPDQVVQTQTDEFKHQDQLIRQTFELRMVNGSHKNQKFTIKNEYQKSQVKSEKYRVGERVFVSFDSRTPSLVQPKRDWILGVALSLVAMILILVVGSHTWQLMASLILNGGLFYFFLKWNLYENDTKVVQIYLVATVAFSLLSLLIVQGFNKKMILTWLATVLGVFLSFALCYVVMKLTRESGIRYEAVDYATQNPKTLFLAQALIGVLGAVMDEATDIISSLSELIRHQPNFTKRQIWDSGLSIGREIMGPLINVLVLIFMASALPMTVLLIRDLNTISYTFQFALSIGILQSLISAIGIVLTVPISTGISILLKERKS